ncbi:MAG: sulfotransferase domain-containing protein [Solirubrobacteraceae bacterium]
MSRATFYLLSYPRSGSTLTRTYFSVLQGRPQLSQYRGDVVTADAVPLTDALDAVNLVKSHHFSPLHRPAIYLLRDGRDAMLSNMFLKFLSGGHRLSRPQEVCTGLRLLADEDEFWGDHVASAMRLAETEDVCFVRYEDLLADPVAALQTMTTFMGATVAVPTLAESVRLVAESRRYRDSPGSGYGHVAEPGSIYDVIGQNRGGDYWRELFDAPARRFFHERGGTAGLLRFGYESSAEWWRAGR